MRKLTVVTDESGEIIGTQLGHGEPSGVTGVTTGLAAGPGQTLHKIDYEMPSLTSRAEIEEFHRKLAAHLRG